MPSPGGVTTMRASARWPGSARRARAARPCCRRSRAPAAPGRAGPARRRPATRCRADRPAGARPGPRPGRQQARPRPRPGSVAGGSTHPGTRRTSPGWNSCAVLTISRPYARGSTSSLHAFRCRLFWRRIRAWAAVRPRSRRLPAGREPPGTPLQSNSCPSVLNRNDSGKGVLAGRLQYLRHGLRHLLELLPGLLARLEGRSPDGLNVGSAASIAAVCSAVMSCSRNTDTLYCNVGPRPWCSDDADRGAGADDGGDPGDGRHGHPPVSDRLRDGRADVTRLLGCGFHGRGGYQ